ncbi:cytochrome c oxidase assembly protein [Jannaschia formosa]|uniref:cytochrome c oxidase assembly protein n=1 Tax=Jannaschia formosa TaxID=2259592 RepID=UPI000E1B5B8D|nr:cytochrome c oxidase assembly protein [Jannaschia formosa]TFL18360.1 cytochrome c oxidase assembly protein [Jannaschia formosa]
MRHALPLLLLSTGPAMAHDGGAAVGPDLLAAAAILAAGTLYLAGLMRLRRQAGAWRGVTRTRAALFAAGLALAAMLLLSPLDRAADRLLSAHMIQHFGLMLLAAPLLVLGRPGLALLWVLPARWRSVPARGPIGALWRVASTPAGAWAVYFVTLWVWHAPPLHQAAVLDLRLHVLQHASFLAAALLFWSAVIEPSRGEGRARALLAVFATAVQSCALAALLTTSRTLWYPVYEGGAWGLSPLQDQQLAGLIMWVPCCAVLVGAAVAIVAALLRDLEARSERSP